MPSVKEPNFFCLDLSPPAAIRDLEAYLSLFSDAKGKKAIGEASPTYLYSSVAAEYIKKFSADARIVIILRNPVDMMYSLHSERLYVGTEEIREFSQALDAEEHRRTGKEAGRGAFFLYRDVARYSKQVRRMFDIFGRERVHVILHEDMEREPVDTFRKLLEFLMVDPEYQPEFGIHNANKTVRIRWLQNLIWFPGSGLKRAVRKFVPKSLKRHLIKAIENANTSYQHRPPMQPVLRRRLTDEFRAEIIELSKLIDRDLSGWLQGCNLPAGTQENA